MTFPMQDSACKIGPGVSTFHFGLHVRLSGSAQTYLTLPQIVGAIRCPHPDFH